MKNAFISLFCFGSFLVVNAQLYQFPAEDLKGSVKSTVQTNYGEDGEPEKKSIHSYYDEQNRPILIQTKKKNRVIKESSWEYKTQGLTEIEILFENFNNWKKQILYIEREYFKDAEGRIISCKTWVSESDSSAKKLTSIEHDAKYNSLNQLIFFRDSSMYEIEDLNYSGSSHCEIEYTNSGQMKRISWFKPADEYILGDFPPNDSIVKVIPYYVKNEDLRPILRQVFEISYDQGGCVEQVTKRTFNTHGKDRSERLESRKTYYLECDELMNIVKRYISEGQGRRKLDSSIQIDYR